MDMIDAMVLSLMKKVVRNGDTRAFIALIDRVEGRPMQRVEQLEQPMYAHEELKDLTTKELEKMLEELERKRFKDPKEQKKFRNYLRRRSNLPPATS